MITDQQWNDAKGWIRQEVGDGSFDSWFKALEIGNSDEKNNVVEVIAPTDFMRDWIDRHYAEVVKRGIQQASKHNPQVRFVVSTVKSNHPTVEKTSHNPKVDSEAKKIDVYSGNHLDPRFTFETFVTGKSNEFAFAAAKRIAESNDLSYNPFFLYGGVGLGKTHLMHAIAWQMMDIYPERKVLYISAEKFLHNFIRSLRDRNTAAFKETFRNVDVLMVDDVQFIAGKEATQEEFFHTFEALISDSKQIILTADQSPHEMKSIEDRLRSRLGWGLATEIHKPDMETRLAILERKAVDLGVQIPKDVALLLADKISSNVRELEGALNRLVAHANLVGATITLESTTEILRDLFKSYDRLVSLEEIQKKVAEFYNIKVSDMFSTRRTRTIARPRQIAMYLAKNLTTKSFPEIGKSFGGRDHTTVIHAVKTIDKLKNEDSSILEDISLLEKMLENN